MKTDDDLDHFLGIRKTHDEQPVSIYQDASKFSLSRDEIKILINRMIDDAFAEPYYEAIILGVSFRKNVGMDGDTYYSTYFYERDRNEDDTE